MTRIVSPRLAALGEAALARREQVLGRELRVAHTANLAPATQAATSAVPNAHRLAPTGIWLRQCGHSRVVASTGGAQES